MSYTIIKPQYRKADKFPKKEWGMRGIVDPASFGAERGLGGELPLIEYTWSTSVDSTGNRVLDNKPSAVEYRADLYFGKGVKTNGTDQSFPINCIGATTLYVFKDGVLTTEDVTAIDTYTADEEVVYSNAITTSKAFTDSQVDYLSKYPEKFLYHEKTVNADGSATWEAKSKILTQDELNSVVAHLPMCETDGYVRDMVGYSEVDVGTDSEFDTGDSWVTQNGASISGSILHLADENYSGANGSSFDAEVGDMFLASIKINSINQINGGISLIIRSPTVQLAEYSLPVGESYFVFTSSEESTLRVYVEGSSTWSGTAEVESVYVKKLTSTYPIANFTTSVRYEAMNLTYGLQTCFLERDELGVITGGSFDSITSNSVADYSITNNFSLENVTNIEFIYEADSSLPKYNYNKLLYIGQGNTSFFRIERLGVGSTLYSEVNTQNTQQYFSFPDDTPIHINYYINQSTDEISLFVNGIIVGDVEALDDPINTEICDLYLMNNNHLARSIMGNIRLFKIHTTPQDPLELYNKAVEKGLLS